MQIKKGKKGSCLRRIAGGVLLLAAAACFAFALLNWKREKTAESSYTELKEEVTEKEEQPETEEDVPEETPEEAPEETPTAAPEVSSEPESYESAVDFEALWERNADAYAWIRIEGTAIDYPILQKEGNDDYYLNTTIDGQSGLPGSIFTETVSARDFSNYNTVIYGHNMRDGSMFAALHNYADINFMEEHPYIEIFLPDQKLIYEIFAAVVFDDSNLNFTYDFSGETDRESFLEDISSTREMQSVVNTEKLAGTEDKLITLSTCIGDRPENRWLVIAKQIENAE